MGVLLFIFIFMFKKYISIFILFSVSFSVSVRYVFAEENIAEHMVISEIQIAGQNASDEFVELYNPTDAPIDISAWSLQYKSATGSTFYKKNFPDGAIIPAGGFFLATQKEYSGAVEPDLIHSSFSLASSGNIFLVSSHDTLETTDNVSIVDAFSWNDLASGKSLERKAKENSTTETMAALGADALLGNGFDSDNSENDFILREISDPQNLTSAMEVFSEGEENHEDTKLITETEEVPIEENTENVQSAEIIENVQDNTQYDYDDVIRINEVFPNPENEEDEFIELENTGSEEINLEGWKIADLSASFLFSEEDFSVLSVAPGKWFVVSRSISALSLNNSSETIFLFSPDGILRDMLSYEDAPEGKSYAKNGDEMWEWTSKRTPNSANELDAPNHAPVASFEIRGTLLEESELLFDASRSSDEDADTLFFSWNFGDGESCTMSVCHKRYHSDGEYEVKLTLYDARGLKDELKSSLEIVALEKTDTSQVILSTEKSQNSNQTSITSSSVSFSTNQISSLPNIPIGSILISAFSPNPEGNDDAEWIELINTTSTTIDISSWKLDDEEGGSTAYVFPEKTFISAGQFLLFQKNITKLSLNNDSDEVRLFDASGNLLSVVSYENAKEGDVLMYKDGIYLWKSTQTSNTNGTQYYIAQVAPIFSTEVLGEEIEVEDIIEVETRHVASLPTAIREAKTRVGEKVVIEGKVTTIPGVWSKQYGYVEDDSGGIQIYFSSGDFPKLFLGNEIRVEGEISRAYGEARIKIKQKEDIVLVGTRHVASLPTAITLLNDISIDTFVEIFGTLLEKKSKEWYLAAFEDELLVPIRFSHDDTFASSIKEGDKLRVVGIFRKRNDRLELWPRTVSDIQKLLGENIKNSQEQEGETQPTLDFSSQKSLNYQTVISSPLWRYFFVLGGIFLSFLGVLLWQYRRSCKKQKNQV